MFFSYCPIHIIQWCGTHQYSEGQWFCASDRSSFRRQLSILIHHFHAQGSWALKWLFSTPLHCLAPDWLHLNVMICHDLCFHIQSMQLVMLYYVRSMLLSVHPLEYPRSIQALWERFSLHVSAHTLYHLPWIQIWISSVWLAGYEQLMPVVLLMLSRRNCPSEQVEFLSVNEWAMWILQHPGSCNHAIVVY